MKRALWAIAVVMLILKPADARCLFGFCIAGHHHHWQHHYHVHKVIVIEKKSNPSKEKEDDHKWQLFW